MPETLLTRDVRAIRRVAPPDAPCEATLAMIENAAYLLVDSDLELAQRAMKFAGAEHVWAPIDLWRRTGGHDVMMPRVVEPLEKFLERRRGDAMRAGEIVTLACSVLRGVAELGDEASAATGRWWATDAGRPVFAVAPGESIETASRRILELLTEHVDDRELSRILREAMVHGFVVDTAALVDSERRLVNIAAPQPVDLGYLGSTLETTRIPTSGSTVEKRRAVFDHPLEADGSARTQSLLLALRGAAARAVTGGRRRFLSTSKRAKPHPANTFHSSQHGASATDTHRPASKKRVWAFASALAIVVIGVGTIWPDEEDSTHVSTVDTGENPGSTATPGEIPTEGAAAEATVAPDVTSEAAPVVPKPATSPVIVAKDGQPDITGFAVAVIASVGTCEVTSTCSELLTDPALAALVPRVGVVELIDDYGGIAVFSIVADDGVATTVAMEKRGERWLIREVYGGER